MASERRDRTLADQCLAMVKAWCLKFGTQLVLTDGWAASAGSTRRAFREKVKQVSARGRCQVHAWPEIVGGTVSKKTARKQAVEVI